MKWMISQELNDIRCMPGRHNTLHAELKWLAPPPNWIKINTDATLTSDDKIGLAAIIRDSTKVVAAMEMRCITGPSNSFLVNQ